MISRNSNFRALDIEEAIKFLEDDPYFPSSGYIKENIWRHIHHYALKEQEVKRLQQIAINHVNMKKIRRDFRYVCKAMAKIALPSFWAEIKEYSKSTDLSVQKSAEILLAYSGGITAGETKRHEIDLEKYKEDQKDTKGEGRL